MMKSLMWLLRCMLSEISMRCCTDTHRDYITVSRRIEDEGLSFLTIALPNFASDFESCLELGQVAPGTFLGFKKRSALPLFLGGLLEQVFDPDDGKLLHEPSEECVLSIRQFCLMFKKILLPCTERRTRAALQKYMECEYEVKVLASSRDVAKPEWYSDFVSVSRLLWGDALSPVAELVAGGEHIPRHGPGVTREGLRGNTKYTFTRWHNRLETYFPSTNFRLCSLSEWMDVGFSAIDFIEPGAEEPVKVTPVPKTLKSPRIIAIEPACMQYAQQSILAPLVQELERHWITGGQINFSDQSINQRLALASSIDGYYATMDLSEASDRVPLDVVCDMLSSVPDLLGAMLDCRSTTAQLPSGAICSLGKFASMGSALCFPVEAMLFFTVIVTARLRELSLPITSRNIFAMSRDVYVYGDDILFPADQVLLVGSFLESIGLKVNGRKTFSHGSFRESCGCDAFNGVDVTPVYLRRKLPTNKHCHPELISLISFANQLYHKGWWMTAKSVRELVESFLGPLPHVRETAPCLGWTSVDDRSSVERWNTDLQGFEIRAPVIRVSQDRSPLEGYGALMKFFLERRHIPTYEGHLERNVRAGSANIKSRWVRVL